ncbi:MAG: hypothetical protein C0403_05905 [Desulfobacterium sp.]|nr:hypothetical protein [Desulfobacterium sp.]
MNKNDAIQPPEQQIAKKARFKRYTLYISVLIVFAVLLIFRSDNLLTVAGQTLVMDSPLSPADAIVVLATGVEYYPRLIEAARLWQKGLARQIIINGNRKTDTVRKLEDMGFEPACHWCEDHLRILSIFDVPENKVQCISAEDAYDTVSEAEFVGNKLLLSGYTKLIITTSKFHSKRAYHIWKDLFQQKAKISIVSAKEDPFQPDAWWKSGRQVKWVLAEYGAWIYYYWKKTTNLKD